MAIDENSNLNTSGMGGGGSSSEEFKAPGVRQIWSMLRVNRFVIGSFIVGSVAATLLYTFFAIPEYRSGVTVSVIVNKPYQSMTEISSEVLRNYDDTTNKVNTLSEYFHSPELAENILEQVLSKGYGPVPLFVEPGIQNILTNLGLVKRISLDDALRLRSKERVAGELMSYLTISPDLNFTAVTIKSTTPNPRFSAFLANEAATALLALNQKMGLRRTTEVKNFLSKEEAGLGNKLKALESELTDFQSVNKIVSVDDTERSILSQIDGEERSIVDTQVLLKTNEKLIAQVKHSMESIRDHLSDPSYNGSNFYLEQMQHRLSMLQYRIDIAAQPGETKSAEEIKAMKTEMESVAKTYKQSLQTRDQYLDISTMTPLEYYRFLESSLSSLRKDYQRMVTALEVHTAKVTELRGGLPKLAQTRQALNEIMRNIQLTNELYLTLRKKLQETEIQEAGTINDLSILNQAAVPQSPHTAPFSMKLFFSLIVGAFFGFLTVLIREALIPTVRGEFDLSRLGLPILGEIPLTGERYQLRPMLIVNEMPRSFEADTLRSMKLRLLALLNTHLPRAKGAKVIQFTSPRSGNGKSFTAANLTTVLAKANYRTLLIDLDLRRPGAHNYFAVAKPQSGVGDLTPQSPKSEIDKAIVKVTPFMHVLFAGKKVSNASEFLDSPLLEHVVSAEHDEYDFIMIDTPPVLGVIDPVLVAGKCDAICLVMEHRKTLREDVAYAQSVIKEAHSKPIFAVINCVHRDFTLLGMHPESEKYFDETQSRGPQTKPASL